MPASTATTKNKNNNNKNNNNNTNAQPTYHLPSPIPIPTPTSFTLHIPPVTKPTNHAPAIIEGERERVDLKNLSLIYFQKTTAWKDTQSKI